MKSLKRIKFLLLHIIFNSLVFEGIIMLFPLCCALLIGELDCAFAFLITIIFSMFTGFLGLFLTKKHIQTRRKLGIRDSFLSLFTGLVVLISISALPYLLSDSGYSPLSAWFESTAGWTTTGATVMDLAKVPNSMLLWKSITNWFGGIMLIILTISIFPILKLDDQKVVSNDLTMSGATKLTAKLRDTLKISIALYIALTITEIIMLLPSKMKPFYILLNVLSSVSTSGIVDITGTSGCFILTPYIQFILGVFALLSSLNFLVYYYIHIRKPKLALKKYEVRIYMGIVVSITLLITISLIFQREFKEPFRAFLDALSQTVSFASTSGFVVDDICKWPTFSKILLTICMLVGSCSFSTGSGIKISRCIVAYRMVIKGIYQRIHPRAVSSVTIKKKPVPEEKISYITTYIFAFFAIMLFSIIIIGFENLDLETTLFSVISPLTNTGTGFGRMTNGDYSIFSSFGQFYTSLLMLIGRLDIFPVLVLFSPSFWNTSSSRI